jgi:hypothetical protein
MNAFPFQIVIIDDDRKMPDSPLFQKLCSIYKKENIVWIENQDDGLAYIKSNLNKRTVVILDYSFPYGENGFAVFKKLQDQSSLLYIVINTSNAIKSIDGNEIKGFINNHLMAYVDKTADGYQKTVEEVAKGFEHLSRGIDCALEEWIAKMPEERRTRKLYVSREDGREWTMDDILHEIRQRSDEGIRYERTMINLVLNLISRDKMRFDP